MTIGSDGRGRRQIVRAEGIWDAVWSFDGHFIVYATGCDTHAVCNIATVGATGTAKRQVTRYREGAGYPDWLNDPWPVVSETTGAPRVIFAQDFHAPDGRVRIRGLPLGRSGKAVREGIFALSQSGRRVSVIKENVMPDQLATARDGTVVTFNWRDALRAIAPDGSSSRALPSLRPPSGWRLSEDSSYVSLWVG